MSKQAPIPGTIYKHFKGNRYLVLGIARDVDYGKKWVYYRRLNGNTYWIRPLSEWQCPVYINGKRTQRFRKVGKV